MLIAFSGKKRSGKDEACAIVMRLIRPSIKLGFADALKEEVARALGTSVNFIESHKDNFRLILQGWGTDYRRELTSENYWIEKLIKKIQRVENDCHYIINDVRFHNEADFVKSSGGMLIRINRETYSLLDEHPSEKELDNYQFDHVIENNGTLKELEEQLIKVLKL